MDDTHRKTLFHYKGEVVGTLDSETYINYSLFRRLIGYDSGSEIDRYLKSKIVNIYDIVDSSKPHTNCKLIRELYEYNKDHSDLRIKKAGSKNLNFFYLTILSFGSKIGSIINLDRFEEDGKPGAFVRFLKENDIHNLKDKKIEEEINDRIPVYR